MTQGGDPDYDALWGGAWQRAAAFGPGFRSRYETLLRLMAQFGAAGRFIEFGAGTGAFLPRVTRRFPWLELSAHEQSSTALAALRALPALHGVYEGPLDAELQLGPSEPLQRGRAQGAPLPANRRGLACPPKPRRRRDT